ncbi:MAG: TauD/TfdA family dioxygenase [Pseudomonadota bacterium]|nr:TauD/TfdA family dioxygenase [Pseudomonadota bacterium]
MSGPFDLADPDAYRDWRARKLDAYPSDAEQLRVEIAHPQALTKGELGRIKVLVAKTGMALLACMEPQTMGKSVLLRFGRRLGLKRLDNNLCADERAVSTLTVRSAGRASEYVPYTNRPLSWHTDGYYNAPDAQVRAWMLYCLQDSLKGGDNALLDHEIAYIRLRDQDPALVRALMDPQALTIPANLEHGVELRRTSTGPVYSVHQGRLHMRYSARTRNVEWQQTPEIQAARDALGRLFSSNDVYIFRHKLAPGEGYVSNNVLHNRSGFAEPDGDGPKRTLLRIRYLDRVASR